MCFQPKLSSGCQGFDPDSSPPCGLIAAAMHFAMVSTTQRHSESRDVCVRVTQGLSGYGAESTSATAA
jgi:hypothetical protein